MATRIETRRATRKIPHRTATMGLAQGAPIIKYFNHSECQPVPVHRAKLPHRRHFELVRLPNTHRDLARQTVECVDDVQRLTAGKVPQHDRVSSPQLCREITLLGSRLLESCCRDWASEAKVSSHVSLCGDLSESNAEAVKLLAKLYRNCLQQTEERLARKISAEHRQQHRRRREAQAANETLQQRELGETD